MAQTLTRNSSKAALLKLRRLKNNELVRVGDFVESEQQGFEPWEGLSGFRADAFVRPMYRRAKSHAATGGK